MFIFNPFLTFVDNVHIKSRDNKTMQLDYKQRILHVILTAFDLV